jgi:acetolactate synthase-1/2/3 large subunit
MTMTELTGGELLARCLANEGIRFVFGLPCPEIDPLLAALDANEIRFVPVRHEAAGAHMAEGLYKTTGGVAAVLGNPGPGSANLLPGVITARHEGVPLVAITAQHRLDIVYPSPPSTFQGQDQLDAFGPSVKWGGPILSWERIPEVTRMAFREMWAGRPGPVQLEIPSPVMYETGDAARVRVLPPESYRPSLPQPSEAQLEQVAELLATAERPAVIAGSGVDRAQANDALRQLVELLGCPLIPSMSGRAVFPRDDPHYVYGFAAGGDLVRREADVVLVVGSRLGNLDLPYDKSAIWVSRARSRSASSPMCAVRSRAWCASSRNAACAGRNSRHWSDTAKRIAPGGRSSSRSSRAGPDPACTPHTRWRWWVASLGETPST